MELWRENPHGPLPGMIADVWAAEQAALMPLLKAFDGFVEKSKCVSPTCLISFDSNRYSVPASFANRSVSMRIHAERLVVAAEGQILCEHGRLIQRSNDVPTRTIYDWRQYLTPRHYPRTNGGQWLASTQTGCASQWRTVCKFTKFLQVVTGSDAARVSRRLRNGRYSGTRPAPCEQAVLAAVEMAIEASVPTKTHVLNLLHRLIDGKTTGGPGIDTPQALTLQREPKANVERYDGLRAQIAGGRRASCSRQCRHLRSLKMYGMAQAVTDRTEQGAPAFDAAVPILSQLLKAARFPAYKDPAGFDFAASENNDAALRQLHKCEFLDGGENVVLIGGPVTGKTHAATALGVQAVEHHRRKVRFFSTIELVKALEQEKTKGKAG